MQSKPAPIEAFVESIKHSKHLPTGSSFDARQTALPPIVTGTSLPFPRVSAATPKVAPTSTTQFFKQKPGKSVTAAGKPLSISAAARKTVQPASAIPKNPFEDDDVGSSAEVKPPKNPFEEDDDYDPSLNPFES